jgi:hypothetical protein
MVLNDLTGEGESSPNKPPDPHAARIAGEQFRPALVVGNDDPVKLLTLVEKPDAQMNADLRALAISAAAGIPYTRVGDRLYGLMRTHSDWDAILWDESLLASIRAGCSKALREYDGGEMFAHIDELLDSDDQVKLARHIGLGRIDSHSADRAMAWIKSHPGELHFDDVTRKYHVE